jgi:Obg family GTPase CgtA
MQFLDKLTVNIESWKWWDGCVSGRREAGVPYGWPSGGNGGTWGSVIFEASKDINTLLAFKYQKKYKAADGEPWRSKEQYGANAENLVLKVPVGTMISDATTGQVLYSFAKDRERHTLLEWGLWWQWNMEFKTPTLQYPTFAILGEPGQSLDVELELQLMGDVALVGSPSVGKSTIINALANTKARVADYHFTTLIPHLGSVKMGDFSFNIVDVPGLIKGASEGKGLGNEFLRHVLKAKIFCIVMDMYNFDQGITEGVDLLLELFLFIQKKLHIDEDLDISVSVEEKAILLNVWSWSEQIKENLFMQKKIMFAFNKFDLIQDEELVAEYLKTFKKAISSLHFSGELVFADVEPDVLDKNIFVISAAAHTHLDSMSEFWKRQLKSRTLKEHVPVSDDKPTLQYVEEDACLVEDISEEEKEYLLEGWYLEELDMKFSKVWKVDNKEFSKLVYTLQWGNDEAEMWFRNKLDQYGFIELLKEAWARKWDILKIKSHYPNYEDRYVQW